MKPDLKKYLIRALAIAALVLVYPVESFAEPPYRQRGDHGVTRDEQVRGHRRSDQDDARDAVRAGRVLPLGSVLQRVRGQYPGQLLDADLVQGRGRPIYRIKMLMPNGSVALVTADAVTGDVLGVRRGGR